MRRLALAATLILPLFALPALAESVVITGTNGGTIERSRDCTRADGQARCTTSTRYTGVEGKTAFKSRVRTTEPGLSVSEIEVTGPLGETRTRKRTVTWGD
jgi:hypothetical protein